MTEEHTETAHLTAETLDALAQQLEKHIGETVALALRGMAPQLFRGPDGNFTTAVVHGPIELQGELLGVAPRVLAVRRQAQTAGGALSATTYVPLADVLHVTVLGKVELPLSKRLSLA